MKIEKAIETLKDMRGIFGERSHNQYSLPALYLAISALEEKLNGGWISVKEKLPESEDNSVLAQFNNGSIETVHIQDYFDDITAGLDENGNQLYTKWYISQGVVAWQPLPEPYKEVENE